jgi:transcription elongation GreA/GreB family factor
MKATVIKEKLVEKCSLWIKERHQLINKTLTDIKLALEEESKSSAGDKHETGRAMLQIERENAGHQLSEIENVEQTLKRVQITEPSGLVHLGSLVTTTQATYFLSISAGKFIIDNKEYYCIAPNAPIAQLLLGKRKGDSFVFHNEEFIIESID